VGFLENLGKTIKPRRGSLGLALGGGAARGIAHIGVIKVLQEEEIPICCVAGTSIGAVVGAFFCAGKSWQEMWEVTQEIKWSELVQPTLSGMGLVKTTRLEKLLVEHLGEITFRELATPLTTVAVNIINAEPVFFDSGPVARAARASASIPGIFEPVETDDGQFLVDGGVTDNLPSGIVRKMGARAVLAVDLNRDSSDGKEPRNLLDVTFRTFTVLMWNTSREGRRDADVLLEPDISHIGFHDLGKAEELFAAGEEAARRVLPKIRKLAN
jgi:NTE family protein